MMKIMNENEEKKGVLDENGGGAAPAAGAIDENRHCSRRKCM